MKKRRIVFLTGTRADFGKLKPLIEKINIHNHFDMTVFVTGMHMLNRYGRSVIEIEKQGYTDVFYLINQQVNDSMDHILANTVSGIARYLHENPCDLLVVHGDRVETLAGAIVGAFNNTLVAHVEGGEVSGTVDELIRHSVTKLAHCHFVANEVARQRLLQMGESDNSIFIIGSPDIDVMLSDALPTLNEVRARYDIAYPNYAISLFHPVTTEADHMERIAREYFSALSDSDLNYVIIYPNNDFGSDDILRVIDEYKYYDRFCIHRSLRFEHFLTLMKHSRFVIGNSSAAVREAPVYGVPSVVVGTRQHRRANAPSIIDVGYDRAAIGAAIRHAADLPPFAPHLEFGAGDSAQKFVEALEGDRVWTTPIQKAFIDRRVDLGAVMS